MNQIPATFVPFPTDLDHVPTRQRFVPFPTDHVPFRQRFVPFPTDREADSVDILSLIHI